MADSAYIVEVTAQNFRQTVLEASMRVPVLVDFWANWCQPCKALLPILSKLADEYRGKFLLAKVNTEEQKELAAHFGIRSIPSLKLFVGGQPVDEFMGALPENEIRAFLDRHIPRASDALIAQADALFQSGEDDAALQLLQQAEQMDPQSSRVLLALAQTLAGLDRIEEAKSALDRLKREDADNPEVQALRSQFELGATLAAAPAPETLAARLAANDNDSEARHLLAVHLVAAGRYEEALEHLLTLMRKDRAFGDDVARKTLLKVFDLLAGDPLVTQYRRQMARLLN
jgi:putative thioredoxin